MPWDPNPRTRWEIEEKNGSRMRVLADALRAIWRLFVGMPPRPRLLWAAPSSRSEVSAHTRTKTALTTRAAPRMTTSRSISVLHVDELPQPQGAGHQQRDGHSQHDPPDGPGEQRLRSEEHTSELQSLMRISYA